MTEQQTIFEATAPDGVTLGCRVRGEGPPLLMVHGVGIDHYCFRRAEAGLAEHFTLYLMDRRGRGLSGDHDDWNVAKEADDVAAVIDAIGGPVNVFGHSFGGMCCYQAATRTANIRRLFLYDPIIPAGGHGARQPVVERLQALAAAGDREEIVRVHLTDWMKLPPDVIARQRADEAGWARRIGWAHTMPREYSAGLEFVFDEEKIGRIAVPTRVMVGENSAPNLRAAGERIAETIPNAGFTLFAGQAHFGFNTAPDAFVAELVAFFQADEEALSRAS